MIPIIMAHSASRRFRHGIPFLVLGLAITSAALAQVTIERDPNRDAYDYVLREGDCRARWSVATDSATGRAVLINYSACRRSLSEQLPMLSKVLAEVVKQKTPKAFVWGRLTPDEPKDDLAMAFRLALAAHRSTAWDSRKGRPRAGHANNFVIEVANQANIYPELKSLFSEFHLDLRLTEGEKVLVMSAATLPFFDRLKAAGVRASEKLPFDFQAYFSVTSK